MLHIPIEFRVGDAQYLRDYFKLTPACVNFFISMMNLTHTKPYFEIEILIEAYIENKFVSDIVREPGRHLPTYPL